MKKQDLVDHWTSLGLTPKSSNFLQVCKEWMEAHYPDVTVHQRETMLKSFVKLNKDYWKRAKGHRKLFLQKGKHFLTKEFSVPSNEPVKRTPENHVQLTSTQGCLFIDNLAAYPDTKVLSVDGNAIYLNRAVLASVSPVLRAAMQDTQSYEDLSIITQLSVRQLQTFYQITTTGYLQHSEGDFKDTREGLEALGINNNKLILLEKVKKDPLGTATDEDVCVGSVKIKMEVEEEIEEDIKPKIECLKANGFQLPTDGQGNEIQAQTFCEAVIKTEDQCENQQSEKACSKPKERKNRKQVLQTREFNDEETDEEPKIDSDDSDDGTDKILCPGCGKNVPLKYKYKHDLMHLPDDKKPYVCRLCDPVKGFVHKSYYNDHQNVHMGIKPHKCELCPNVAYASKANLSAHIRATHQGKKRKPKAKKAFE